MKLYRLGHTARSIGHILIEELYPRRVSCVFCGRHWSGDRLQAGLCPACLYKWRQQRRDSVICPVCGSFDSGDPCTGPCADSPGIWPARIGSLTGIVAASPYSGVYRQRVMSLKYEKAAELAKPLACLMASAWAQDAHREHIRPAPLLVPVPIHKLKEEQRGYNQSLLLARALSRETGYRVEELLWRPAPGQVQAGLDKRQRQKALADAFRWRPVSGGKARPAGPAIIVDDVVTTGATLEHCGAILREQGYGPLWGLTFAGGSGAGHASNASHASNADHVSHASNASNADHASHASSPSYGANSSNGCHG